MTAAEESCPAARLCLPPPHPPVEPSEPIQQLPSVNCAGPAADNVGPSSAQRRTAVFTLSEQNAARRVSGSVVGLPRPGPLRHLPSRQKLGIGCAGVELGAIPRSCSFITQAECEEGIHRLESNGKRRRAGNCSVTRRACDDIMLVRSCVASGGLLDVAFAALCQCPALGLMFSSRPRPDRQRPHEALCGGTVRDSASALLTHYHVSSTGSNHDGRSCTAMGSCCRSKPCGRAVRR